MLLTFAELGFLSSLAEQAPEMPLLDLLEERCDLTDGVAALGQASLVYRGLCRESGDEWERYVDLDREIVELHAAIHAASSAVRIATVSPERSTFWLLLLGPFRAAFSPGGAGLYGAVIVPADVDLFQQVVSLVASAMVDDPEAGVAITRTGRLDAMSFRTNAELGGPVADPAARRAAIEVLVQEVLHKGHPSQG